MKKTTFECTGIRNCDDYMRLNKITMSHEKKLKEYMTPEEFDKYNAELAKQLIKDDFKKMPEGDFKNFFKDFYKKSIGEDIE